MMDNSQINAGPVHTTRADAWPSVSFRTVLGSIIVLWAVYFILATIRWEIIGLGQSAEMMQLRLIVTLGGIAVTLVLWSLLRLFDAKSFRVQTTAALLLAMPAALLSAQINNYVFLEMNQKFAEIFEEAERAVGARDTGVSDAEKAAERSATDIDLIGEPDMDGAGNHDPALVGFLGPLAEIAFSRYFMMLAWSAIYFAMVAISKARLAERREQESRNAAKAAELRSLRYQVNPHFLFNTLNSLSALVMTGKADRAERMIQTISRFYRHSLADDPTSDVRLDDEFDLQSLYLDIESVRFPERLRCNFELPPELADARVPGLILQPLVENSVKYAVSNVSRPVTITVSAAEEFDRLVLTVSDDGPGIPAGASHGFGIGLANVRDRLEARFGPDIALDSGPVPGGYRTQIRIPLTRNG